MIDLRLRILTCTCRWELGDDLASVLRFATDDEEEQRDDEEFCGCFMAG